MSTHKQASEELREKVSKLLRKWIDWETFSNADNSNQMFPVPEFSSHDVIEGLMSLITQYANEARKEGAENAERIIRMSPDPRQDFKKYISGLEKEDI